MNSLASHALLFVVETGWVRWHLTDGLAPFPSPFFYFGYVEVWLLMTFLGCIGVRRAARGVPAFGWTPWVLAKTRGAPGGELWIADAFVGATFAALVSFGAAIAVHAVGLSGGIELRWNCTTCGPQSLTLRRLLVSRMGIHAVVLFTKGMSRSRCWLLVHHAVTVGVYTTDSLSGGWWGLMCLLVETTNMHLMIVEMFQGFAWAKKTKWYVVNSVLLVASYAVFRILLLSGLLLLWATDCVAAPRATCLGGYGYGERFLVPSAMAYIVWSSCTTFVKLVPRTAALLR